MLKKDKPSKRGSKRIKTEYEKFKKKMLTRPVEEVYDECGKIYFYTEVSHFLIESDIKITPQMTLSNLWHLYLSDEFASVNTWYDIKSFIDNNLNKES